MTRITQSHLNAQAEIATDLTGRAVVIYGAYGGYGVHEALPGGGVSDLMGGTQTAREASRFLSGMIAGARMVRETASAR